MDKIYIAVSGSAWENAESTFCLLMVTTQHLCKFISAGCWYAVEKCLRAIQSGNQLGSCIIWDDIRRKYCILSEQKNVESPFFLAYRIVRKKDM